MIDPLSSSTVTVVVGNSLTLSYIACTLQGSPSDTRTIVAPIVQFSSITTVTHTNTLLT